MKTLSFNDINILKDIKKTLRSDGVCLVECGRTKFNLLELVESIGTPHSHDSKDSFLWDIKVTNTQDTLARSLTSEPFTLHTDCSFEDPPPQYFALYVVQEDRQGGGETLLLDMKDVLKLIPKSIEEVLRTPYATRAPDEFYKGKPLTYLPILFGESSMRYRPECLDKEQCSQEQLRALAKFEKIIAAQPVQILNLPNNTLIFVDNYRFVHGRTKVLDPERRLQRVRFN